eukprot:Skav211803  [mRNA]  locus=scaffold305:438628:439074:+ [translate_table: standard]
MNTEIYGEGHPSGDPSWYQAYNTPYYNDTHKQFRQLMREYVDEHIMGNVHDGMKKAKMYLEAGKQGALALGMGWPWPEKYFGPGCFHEFIMHDKMSRAGSVSFQRGIAGGTTIGPPPCALPWNEDVSRERRCVAWQSLSQKQAAMLQI